MIDEKYVVELVCREVENAMKKHGEKFANDYEFMSALKCEIAETKEHFDTLQARESFMWSYLKTNHGMDEGLACDIYGECIEMIREATQIAAVCHKRIDWRERRDDEKSRMIADYAACKECENYETWFTCLKCGKCGRKFENGIMVDDGGTTVEGEK